LIQRPGGLAQARSGWAIDRRGGGSGGGLRCRGFGGGYAGVGRGAFGGVGVVDAEVAQIDIGRVYLCGLLDKVVKNPCRAGVEGVDWCIHVPGLVAGVCGEWAEARGGRDDLEAVL